jgi:hypothetical protein
MVGCVNFCGEDSKPLDVILGLPCAGLSVTRRPIDPLY